jgi:hypothetical protein
MKFSLSRIKKNEMGGGGSSGTYGVKAKCLQRFDI